MSVLGRFLIKKTAFFEKMIIFQYKCCFTSKFVLFAAVLLGRYISMAIMTQH